MGFRRLLDGPRSLLVGSLIVYSGFWNDKGGILAGFGQLFGGFAMSGSFGTLRC